MAESVRYVLFFTLTIAFFASADGTTDSVPAAITVYRNPKFFRNLTNMKEDLENEEAEDEDGKGDAYSNNSEDFYDFDDEYKYPGEPKKPNPPAAPDFYTYFDESPEFQPEPRQIPGRENLEEEQSEEAEEENELSSRSTTPSYYHYANQEEPDREMGDEEVGDRESTEHRDATDDSGDRYDDGSEEEKEASEEDDSESVGDIENDEPPKKGKYYFPTDKDLRMKVPPKIYEESKEYFNPILNGGITAFHYPSTYEDLDYYSYEEDDRKKPYVDNKKGTREYLKDHSIEEVEDQRNRGNVRADSKHIFRTVSKIGIKAFKPVFYVPHHVARIKKKYKILHKPKFHGWRHFREVPDDSVYQLSSDYDSDFEFF